MAILAVSKHTRYCEHSQVRYFHCPTKGPNDLDIDKCELIHSNKTQMADLSDFMLDMTAELISGQPVEKRRRLRTCMKAYRVRKEEKRSAVQVMDVVQSIELYEGCYVQSFSQRKFYERPNRRSHIFTTSPVG